VGFDKKIEVFAELSILAISMFFAAFFCLKILCIPKGSSMAIDKINEIEQEIYKER